MLNILDVGVSLPGDSSRRNWCSRAEVCSTTRGRRQTSTF